MGMDYPNTGTLDMDLIANKISTEGVGFVNAGGTAGTARPTGWACILWVVDAITPTNAVEGDIIADLNDDTVVVHTP